MFDSLGLNETVNLVEGQLLLGQHIDMWFATEGQVLR